MARTVVVVFHWRNTIGFARRTSPLLISVPSTVSGYYLQDNSNPPRLFSVNNYSHLASVYVKVLLEICSVYLFLAFFIGLIAGISTTIGAHRLWSHRCYKATTGLRIFLALIHGTTGQVRPYALLPFRPAVTNFEGKCTNSGIYMALGSVAQGASQV